MTRKKNITGERKRFNMSLDPYYDRDRLVGDWLDAQYNASESVKNLIAAVVTGQREGMQTVPITFDVSGNAKVDRDDPHVQALLGFDT